jgi:hypothetical protein
MSVEDLQQEGFNLRKSVHVRHDVVLPLIDIHRKGWIEGLSCYLQVTCTYPPSHYDLFIYHNIFLRSLRGKSCWDPEVGLIWANSHTSQEPWPWNTESPKESVQRLCQDTFKHFQNHAVWSWALKWRVKACVTGPSTKCHFNEFLLSFLHLFMFIFYFLKNSSHGH